MKKLINFIIILTFSSNVFSTHVTGGYISWNKIEYQTYEVKLTLYRDCSGINLGGNAYMYVNHINIPNTLQVQATKVTENEVNYYCGPITTCNGGPYFGVTEGCLCGHC